MASRLTGKNILVVEDEYFIATDISRALQAEGAKVVGPVGRLEQGLALAEQERVDAALLDVNLGATLTLPIADRLGARSIPCMFLTGYDEWSLPEPYRAAPRMTKPFTARAMLDAVVGLVGSEAA